MKKRGKQWIAMAMATLMAFTPLESVGMSQNVQAAPAEKSGEVGDGSSQNVTPAFFWDFESNKTEGITLKGTAKLTQQNIQIGENTYLGADNHVLELGGGAKGSSYAELPSNLYEGVDAQTGFTYSFWIKPDAGVGSYSRVVSGAAANSKNEFAFAPYARDKVWNLLFDDTNIVRAPMNTELQKGIWSLFTFTVDSDEIIFYINGKETDSFSSSELGTRLDMMETLVNNALGKTCSTWGDSDAKVMLDDVSLYKQTLTPRQVADLANSYGFQVTVSKPQELGSDTQWTDGTNLVETAAKIEKGQMSAKIMTDEATGRYFITAAKGGKVVLDCSWLGMETDVDLTKNLELQEESIAAATGKESYELTTGNQSRVEEEYSQLQFTLKEKTSGQELQVIVRCFEDGVAYRYELKGQAGQKGTVKSEASEYVIPSDSIIWAGYDEAGNYEYEYQKTKMSQVKQKAAKYSVPFLAKSEGENSDMWTLFTEAAVFSNENPYCASHLETSAGSRNLKFKFGKGSGSQVAITYDKNGSFVTPWRALICGDNLNDIVNATMITSLNPQADETLFADVDQWVRTGTVAWSWWSEAGDDPIEYDQQKDYIDFAAENGWEYVCLDFGWCLWADYKNKVKELVEYGREKNVDIMLWYGVNNDNHSGFKDAEGASAYPKYSLKTAAQLKEQFEWCRSVGVKGVKVDYYENDDTETMKLMYDCAVIAAQNKINVLFHGCTAPRGEHRTFPNVLGYEAVRGSEYYKWNIGPSVFNCLIYSFSRNIAGGMDFTPVGMQIDQLPVTAGFQLSQVVAYQSGFQNIASSVYKLEGFKGLALINDVPTQWEETKVLEGDPGNYQTIARRSKEKTDEWYISAMTARERTAQVKLDFLGEGEYHAYLYEDNTDGSDIVMTERSVTSGDTLNLQLHQNGGASVKIAKEAMNTATAYDNYTYYEAEKETNQLSGNTTISKNQFASGQKQVAGVGGTKFNTVTFQDVTVEKAGVYEMKLYYACGVPRRICYTVNDGDSVRSKKLNAGVNTLAMEKFYVTLKQGTNQIAFGNDETKAPNIDRIAISAWPVQMEPTKTDLTDDGIKPQDGTQYDYQVYEAKNAVVSGGAAHEGDSIGWLGNSAASQVKFTVSVPKEGNYKLQIQYFAGETRNVYVKVNQEQAKGYSCPSTGSYTQDSADSIYADVHLKAGSNEITLMNANGWCPNILSIGISKVIVSSGNHGNNTNNTQNGNTNNNTNNNQNNNQNNKQNVKAKKVQVKAAGYAVNKITLKKGAKLTLAAWIQPSNASQKVTYKLSKKGIVSVSGKGVVKAKKAGKVTITISSNDGNAKTKVQVKVVNKKVTNKKLKLKKSKFTLKKKGGAAQIEIKTLTKNTTDKITYKVVKGKKYVKVDKYGMVMAKVKASSKAQKATIEVKCGKSKKKVQITLKK